VVLHPPLTTSPPVGPLHPSQQTLEGILTRAPSCLGAFRTPVAGACGQTVVAGVRKRAQDRTDAAQQNRRGFARLLAYGCHIRLRVHLASSGEQSGEDKSCGNGDGEAIS
jgi:hypothetical protein